MLIKLKIDDPTDAISIHAAGGALGLFLAPFVSIKYGIISRSGSEKSLQYLGWNLVTIVVLIGWSFACIMLVFCPLAFFGKLGKKPKSERSRIMRECLYNDTYKGTYLI